MWMNAAFVETIGKLLPHNQLLLEVGAIAVYVEKDTI